jgi:hypothetical protein
MTDPAEQLSRDAAGGFHLLPHTGPGARDLNRDQYCKDQHRQTGEDQIDLQPQAHASGPGGWMLRCSVGGRGVGVHDGLCGLGAPRAD